MADYRFRILNVFALAGQPLSGNPLCVFEDARGLDEAVLQALALQFNLSETTFILPSETATARVRIFTPGFELPFAGHPTLGTAQVVRALTGAGDSLVLEMKAGRIPVIARGNTWTLRANPPAVRPAEATAGQLAGMLGLSEGDVGDAPLWVDTGAEQLVIPLRSAEAVHRCAPDPALLVRHGCPREGLYMAYVWAEAGEGRIEARFFFPKGNALAEDPATGSACANLGGWFLSRGAKLPLVRTVRQGAAVKRPSLLGLRVDAERNILVSGEVANLGRGVISL